MKIETKLLAEALLRYSQALLEGRTRDAIDEASRIYMHGELVIIHPAFIKHFTDQPGGLSPEQVLRQMSHFLSCVADGLRDGYSRIGYQTTESALPLPEIIARIAKLNNLESKTDKSPES